MNVILLQDVEKLGKQGTEIKVKDGYARNFLIPNQLAVQSTPAARNIIEKKRRERERLEKKLKEESIELADKISKISCTISMEAGEEDKLFGSVTSDTIAESLLAEGIEIDKRKILLEEPLKKLGVYNVEIKLHPEVKAEARIWIVKK